MVIEEVSLHNFGKFHNKELELRPNINIIYGENEAGKSTVHAFIHGMLFGMERLRGRGAHKDEYSRYQPWINGKNYEGVMLIEHQGEHYRLHRSFYKEDESFTVNVASTRENISLSGKTIEAIIENLNEANYRNTISIRQQKSRLDDQFAASLQNYIANLSMTKDEEIHISEAVEALKKERKKVQDTVDSEGLLLVNRSIESLELQVCKKEQLQESLDEYQSKLNQAKRSLEHLKAQQNEAGRAIKEEQFAAVQIREKLKNTQEAYEEKHTVYQQLHSRIEEELPVNHFKIIAILLVIMAALTGAFSLFGTLAATTKYIAAGIALLLLILGLYTAFKSRRTQQYNESAFDTDELSRMRLELEQLKQEWDYLEEQMKPYYDKFGPSLMSEYNPGQEQLERLSAAKEQLKTRIDRCLWEYEQLEDKAAQLVALKEQKVRMEAEARHAAKEIQAIEIALKTIEDLSTEIHRGFGTILNQSVEQIFGEITGETSAPIHIDEQLNIRLDNSRNFIRLDQLSAGTIDQLYFALRFCAGEILFPNEKMPIILDDPFVMYDDRRLANIMRWLIQHQNRQIIIFTCHHREADMLDELGSDYNYIYLSEDD